MNNEKNLSEKMKEAVDSNKTMEELQLSLNYITDYRYREKLMKAFLKEGSYTVFFPKSIFFPFLPSMFSKTVLYENRLRNDGFQVWYVYDALDNITGITIRISDKAIFSLERSAVGASGTLKNEIP